MLCRRAKKKRAGLDASRTRREAKFGRIARRCAFCALKRTSSAPFWSGRVRTPPARGVASLDVDFRKLALRALFPPHTHDGHVFFPQSRRDNRCDAFYQYIYSRLLSSIFPRQKRARITHNNGSREVHRAETILRDRGNRCVYSKRCQEQERARNESCCGEENLRVGLEVGRSG